MTTFLPQGDPTTLLVVLGALFVHMSYQLSVSVLTYFSSQSLSRRVSEKRLLALGTSYGFGAVLTTTLILFGIVALTGTLTEHRRILVGIATIAAPLVGIATILWYYRRGKGTKLWLPRSIANYLLERSRKTKSNFEAFMLGAGTVVGELPFIAAPLLLVAFVINQQSPEWWTIGSFAYALLAYLPLLVVTMYLTSGHSIARVQRWRETNKSFLQWTSGLMLMVVSTYLVLVQFGVLV